jgi:hypothetical protein
MNPLKITSVEKAPEAFLDLIQVRYPSFSSFIMEDLIESGQSDTIALILIVKFHCIILC